MTLTQKIAKNAMSLTFSLVVRKIVSMFYFGLIARYFSVYETGFFFLLTVCSVFLFIILDCGLSNAIVREGAKEKEKINFFLNHLITIKVPIILIAFIVLFLILEGFRYPPITRHLAYIFFFATVLESFSRLFYCCFRALNVMRYEGWGVILGQFIMLIAGGLSIFVHKSLYFIIGAIAINHLFNFVYSLIISIVRFRIIPSATINKSIITKFLRIGFPMAMASIFGSVYMFDAFLLYKFVDVKFIGWYSIPSKVVTSLFFIAIALAAAVFPVMSDFYKNSHADLLKIYAKITNVLLWISLPMSVGIFSLAPEIIEQIFGDKYLPSAVPLKIMAFSLIPAFLYCPISSLLNASGREITSSVNQFFALFFHVAFCILLIPRYQVVGVAISFLLGNVFVFFLGVYSSRKIIKGVFTENIEEIGKTVVATLLMGLCVYSLRGYINVIFSVLVGFVIYFAISYVIHGVGFNGFKAEMAQRHWLMIRKYVFGLEH